jgi:hypothetical protein
MESREREGQAGFAVVSVIFSPEIIALRRIHPAKIHHTSSQKPLLSLDAFASLPLITRPEVRANSFARTESCRQSVFNEPSRNSIAPGNPVSTNI